MLLVHTPHHHSVAQVWPDILPAPAPTTASRTRVESHRSPRPTPSQLVPLR